MTSAIDRIATKLVAEAGPDVKFWGELDFPSRVKHGEALATGLKTSFADLTAEQKRSFALVWNYMVAKSQGIDDLEPADPTQCQSYISNGVNFMTMGGRHEMIRCTQPPTAIALEVVAGSDGRCGAMSLCDSCLKVFRKQMCAPPGDRTGRDPYAFYTLNEWMASFATDPFAQEN